MKKIYLTWIFAILIQTATPLFCQTNTIPEKPKNELLVNDFAGFLNQNEKSLLERKLVAYNDSSSSQVAVVTVTSLNGYEINDFGTKLFNSWGIGQKIKNNGVLVVIKPRINQERGQIAIITGYGAEPVLPDIICKRIIDNELIPLIKEGKHFDALDKATSNIYSLLRKEFTPDQYLNKKSKKKEKGFPVAIIIIIIIVIIASIKKGSSNNRHISSGGGLPIWMLLSMLNSGNHRGTFGDFNSGGGIFGSGSSGGGFGGFGGGMSGGGGASGSW